MTNDVLPLHHIRGHHCTPLQTSHLQMTLTCTSVDFISLQMMSFVVILMTSFQYFHLLLVLVMNHSQNLYILVTTLDLEINRYHFLLMSDVYQVWWRCIQWCNIFCVQRVLHGQTPLQLCFMHSMQSPLLALHEFSGNEPKTLNFPRLQINSKMSLSITRFILIKKV